jgi:hypothetical protein
MTARLLMVALAAVVAHLLTVVLVDASLFQRRNP